MSHYQQRNDEGAHRIADDDPLALRLLKEEHQVFRTLFDQANAADGKAVKPIGDELCMRLSVHMALEEELLYPALKPVIGAEEVNEGIVEHGAGKQLLAEIEQLTGEEELYKPKVHVLGEQTIHHIDEEDEELFADAKQAHAAGKIDLDALGERLRARQAELYDQIAAEGELGPTHEAMMEEVPTV